MEREANSSMSSNAREWKSIKIAGADHIISTSSNNNSWKIAISNLIEIWTETITRDVALARCQSLNLLLDLDSFDVNETLETIFNDIPKYATYKSLDELKLESSIDGIVFKFTINLTKGSPQQFWNEITKPLCHSSMELHRRHTILLDLIQKKDEELSEYKLSGAQLTRKNIETLPYNKDIFGNQISILNSKSEDCITTFQSMMDLYNESKKCESSLNNVHKHLPQKSSERNHIEHDRVLKRENMEASEMTLSIDVHNSNELQPISKIETTTEHVLICGSEAPTTEIIEQCGVGRIRPSASESNIDVQTTKDERKKFPVNNVAKLTLSSIDQPSNTRKKLKKAPNIYDFIA